jgi:hypothetical protein
LTNRRRGLTRRLHGFIDQFGKIGRGDFVGDPRVRENAYALDVVIKLFFGERLHDRGYVA